MPNDALLWNAPPPPRCQPRAAEPLWTLQKRSELTDIVLRYHGEYGAEAQFFRRGEFLYGRRFDLKAQALQWAELERQTLERDGWQRCELPTSRNEDGS